MALAKQNPLGKREWAVSRLFRQTAAVSTKNKIQKQNLVSIWSLTVAWMANDCLESIALELVVCVGSVIWMLEWIDAPFRWMQRVALSTTHLLYTTMC